MPQTTFKQLHMELTVTNQVDLVEPQTPLEAALLKALPEIDLQYWMERLGKFQQDTWVQPTNHEDNDYSLFDTLFEYHLAVKKTTPVWSKGIFKGVRVFFKYNLELKFEST